MKKLTILALHLGYGGLERSIASLVNLLAPEYKIEIISIYKLYDIPPYPMDERVKIKYLIEDDTALRVDRYKKALKNLQFDELAKSLWKDYLRGFHFLRLIRDTFVSGKILIDRKRLMKKEIRDCDSDVIISTRDFLNQMLGEYGRKKATKIAWEHNHHHGDEKYIERITNSCQKMDYLVLVSDSLRRFYKKKLKDTKCKCVYIPNILESVPEKLSDQTEKRLISVGRLSPEKGFGDLVDVFVSLHEKRPDWRLEIIGDGAQKNLVCDKIYLNQLTDFVTVHGYQKKDYIDSFLNESSIFVMTSFTESFGLVLIEAMSHGLPCVAFDSAEGANDLIEDGVNGYLIPNREKEAMVEQLITLIDNQKLRKEMGKSGREKSLEFTPDLVKKHWMKLLKR